MFERARNARRLSTRIYAAVPIDSWERLRDHVVPYTAEATHGSASAH